jgi:O-antigen ligase
MDSNLTRPGSPDSAGRSYWLAALFAACILLTAALSFLPVRLTAGAPALVCLAALFLWRPVWGLAAIAGLLSLEGIAAQDLGMSEIRLAGIAAFSAWVIHLLATGKRLRVNRTLGAAVAFVLWAGVSFLWMENPRHSGGYYGTLVQQLLLFLMTVNVIESRRDFQIVAAAFLLGAAATSWMSIGLFVQNMIERARAFEGQNANQYAAVVGLAVIFGIYLTAELKNRWLRLGSLILSVGLAIPLILAQSRSAWLAVLSALCVFIWHTRHRVRNFILILAAVLSLVSLVFIIGLANISLIQRAGELGTMRERGSDRLDIWHVAGRIIADHPVAGVGFMQFPVVFNRYRAVTDEVRKDQVSNRDPHNVYFGVTAELGLVGLFLLGLVFWNAWREEKLPPGAAPWINRALIVFLMVFAMGGSIHQGKFFWLALALAVKARTLAAYPEPEPVEEG